MTVFRHKLLQQAVHAIPFCLSLSMAGGISISIRGKLGLILGLIGSFQRNMIIIGLLLLLLLLFCILIMLFHYKMFCGAYYTFIQRLMD